MKCFPGVLKIPFLIFFAALVSALSLASGCVSERHAATNDSAIMNSVPVLFGDRYSAPEFTRALNMLRSCGKDRALTIMSNYLENPTNTDRDDLQRGMQVVVLCRLIFVPPAGKTWGFMPLGEIRPVVDQKGAEKIFPQFPFVFSRGIPFFLAEGSIGGGNIGQSVIVEQCQRYAMVTSDFPTSGFEEAARELVGSPEFRALYPNPETLTYMTRFVLEEAKPK